MGEEAIRWGDPHEKTPDPLARDYISFFLGDREIQRYDFVYLSAGEDLPPYVGMVTRLWHNLVDNTKKLQVRWMYRANDMDVPIPDSCEKELFLALGSGEGSEDTNNLETVEGKCNCQIILHSEDDHDWRPSEEETAATDFFVYRCYDSFHDRVYGVGTLRDALERLGALRKSDASTARGPKPQSQIYPLPEIHPAKKLKKMPTSRTEAPSSSRAVVQKAPRIDLSQRKLFKKRSWEDILEDGYAKNKVILLRHFDPAWCKEEVKEALASVFPEVQMEVEVVPQHSVFGGQTGEAIVVFRDNAQMNEVLNAIQENCLLLSEDSGPCIAVALQRPTQTFYGHLPIEKYWRAQADKFREAVSTSHCAQPNTIEFEMALQWRVLDERHRLQEELLAKRQAEEVEQLLRS